MATKAKRPVKNHKKSEGSPTVKALRFIVRVSATATPIPIAEFEADERRWGGRRRFLDFIDSVNDGWAECRGTPLFEYLGEDHEPNPQFRKYIQRVDADDVLVKAQNVAALPALMQFVRTLDKTPFSQAWKQIYGVMEQKVAKSAKKPLVRIGPKYHLVTKGAKDYGRHEDVLEEVNKALLYEKVLTVTRLNAKDGGVRTDDLEPLSLLMYNGGLYLLARFHPSKDGAKYYSYRVESFVKAECKKGATFDYPVGFNPADHFKESFGLFNTGETLKTVEIEILDPSIESYVTERRWTEHQSWDPATKVFTMKVRDVTEIRSWALSFGPLVRVRKPDSLRQEVENQIDQMMQVYKSA